MSDGDRAEQLEVHLLATARGVRRAYDTRLAEIGLGMTESGILQTLELEGPLSQSSLAHRLHIGRSATGGFIEALTARGFVERHRAPEDGRVWLVSNTAAGSDAARRCAATNREVLAELRSGLTRSEQRQLAALLDRVRANAAQVDDRPAGGQAT